MKLGAPVLAVCGAAAHLARARHAVACLRRQGAGRVVVVTDPARNRGELPDAEIVAAPIDPRWSDAQAAILLKTAVAEHVDDGEVHLYLDSDVLAIAGELDEALRDWRPPVVFASDLPFPGASLRTFSPFALRCACRRERERMARFFARLDTLAALHRAHDDLRPLADAALYEQPRFTGERRRGKWWTGVAKGGQSDGAIRFVQEFVAGEPVRIEYRFAGSPFRLIRDGANGSRFEDGGGAPLAWVEDPGVLDGGYWQDGDGDSLRRRAVAGGEERLWYSGGVPRKRWRALESDGGGVWADLDGGHPDRCDHLAEALERIFGVALQPRDWVPWNGGVFLFGPGSRGFLADWRERCLRLFAEPDFLVRDQGALAAAVFAAGLADHPRLSPAFNRIVDRRAPEGARARLQDLRAEGARLVHLIGGGALDPEWRLAREIVESS